MLAQNSLKVSQGETSLHRYRHIRELVVNDAIKAAKRQGRVVPSGRSAKVEKGTIASSNDGKAVRRGYL
jgi:hypothetical protein